MLTASACFAIGRTYRSPRALLAQACIASLKCGLMATCSAAGGVVVTSILCGAWMLLADVRRITVDSDPAAFPVYQAYVEKVAAVPGTRCQIWWDLHYLHDALAKHGMAMKKKLAA